MNQLDQYIITCRTVFQARENDPTSWSDLHRLIPELCASLSCSVCSKLATDPLSPVNPEPEKQHVICTHCVPDEDQSKYAPNNTLKILISSFKKLCEYVVCSPLIRCLDNNENLSTPIIDTLLQCVGTDFKLETVPKTTTVTDEICIGSVDLMDVITNGNKTGVCDDMFANVIFTQNFRHSMKRPIDDGNSDPKRTKFLPDGCRTRHTKPRIALKKGCRCGNATSMPGKLTCYGQRCPCYVSAKSCVGCRCKGCRNPHETKVITSDCGKNSDVEVL